MIYNLSNSFDVERFRSKADYYIAKGKEVELKLNVRQRSLAHNRYLHLCLGYFGAWVGCSLDYVKLYYYKLHCNHDLFVHIIHDPVLGKDVNAIRSTRDLSIEQMTLSIERFRNWASAEGGINIPSPEDQAAIAEMERQVSLNAEYL